MTCFTREEMTDILFGFLRDVVPWALGIPFTLGCALAVLILGVPRARPCRRPCCRRPGRRRRPPLAVLAHPDHNPDLDGVHAPPAEEETQ